MANDLDIYEEIVKFLDDTISCEIIWKEKTRNRSFIKICECSNWAVKNSMKFNPPKTKKFKNVFQTLNLLPNPPLLLLNIMFTKASHLLNLL